MSIPWRKYRSGDLLALKGQNHPNLPEFYIILQVIGDNYEYEALGNVPDVVRGMSQFMTIKEFDALPLYLVGTNNAPLKVEGELKLDCGSKHLCQCDRFQVVHFGCKCGGI